MSAKKAALPASKATPQVDEDEDSDIFYYDPFADEKFTVRDILRMFKLSLCGISNDSSTEAAEDHDEQLEMFIKTHSRQGASEQKATTPTPPTRQEHRSPKTGVAPSNSAMLQNLFATSEVVLERKEPLVHPIVREAYRRLLESIPCLPNSTLKRLPDAIPLPRPSWEQVMRIQVFSRYRQLYGRDEPRSRYPLLPARKRPPPPHSPEPDCTGRNKTGEKAKAVRK
ncbi:hypothetical protein ACOMHN_035322 [Nucella lapillus]